MTGKERASERRRYRRPSLTIGLITAGETITSLRWVTEIVNFRSTKNVANSVIVFPLTFDPFQKRSISKENYVFRENIPVLGDRS